MPKVDPDRWRPILSRRNMPKYGKIVWVYARSWVTTECRVMFGVSSGAHVRVGVVDIHWTRLLAWKPYRVPEAPGRDILAAVELARPEVLRAGS